jgi:hypothetical protein
MPTSGGMKGMSPTGQATAAALHEEQKFPLLLLKQDIVDHDFSGTPNSWKLPLSGIKDRLTSEPLTQATMWAAC